MVLNFDLNQLPSNERNGCDELSPNLSLSTQNTPSEESRRTRPPTEVIDEEVAIISPVTFAKARAKSRRNNRNTNLLNGANVLNCDSARPACTNFSPHLNKMFSQNSEHSPQQETGREIKMKESSSPTRSEVSSSPTEVRCPICRGELVEETSTRCGHIFCKEKNYLERPYEGLHSNH